MAASKRFDEMPHRINVKLYPNHLSKGKGEYIARTTIKEVLSIEEVCASMVRRGAYSGNYHELVNSVHRFFDEAAYQLCNGFAINTGYFSIQPHVSGTFNSPRERFNPAKHSVSFRIRAGAKLRRLADSIDVVISGVADTAGYIKGFTDAATNTVNKIVSGGEPFVITGDKIKVVDDGENTDCGIFFEPLEEPGKLIKVPGRLAENTNRKIIGIAPELPASRAYRLVIVTQFNGSTKTFLKKPKTLASSFELMCL